MTPPDMEEINMLVGLWRSGKKGKVIQVCKDDSLMLAYVIAQLTDEEGQELTDKAIGA